MAARGPKRKVKPRRVVIVAPGVPPAPGWLDKEAAKEYGRVVKLLAPKKGLLQKVDMGVLSAYAQSYADVARLNEEIKEMGGEAITNDRGNLAKNPLVDARKDAYTRMMQAAGRLGFTPMDRERLKVPAPEAAPDGIDEFLKG